MVFVIIIAAVLFGLSRLNRYQQEGALTLPGLKEAVTVLRDEKGMAYIYAKNPDDALMAMGFITAQDRLFQMELTRLFATGRISDMIGEKGGPLDTRMRTIGLHRLGKRHAGILDAQTKLFTQKYIDGINAYIKNGSKEHPLEFNLAGIKPGLWDFPDVLAIMYLMSWNSAANIETEFIAQMLIEKVGLEKAKKIFPLNINPDDLAPGTALSKTHAHESSGINLASDQSLLAYLQDRPLHIGSNNWTTGPKLSPGGKPILANDPHLDSRILPGPWYPCGIITSEFRMVGVSIPGIPVIVVGRNEHIAIGVTNACGDSQDLYIETLDPKDPNRYLEGDKSLPFEVLCEKLFIKDKNALDQPAPTIFQAVYREFAFLTFQDELGQDLALTMLKNWYFWQERLKQMVLEGTSPWFDNVLTKDLKETRNALFQQAALAAADKLRASLGKYPKEWKWGKVHTIEFVSPIRREGFGKGLLGDGPHAFLGSGETLCRGIYEFKDPFKVTNSASLRMVADLSDDDKVLAVLPGGVSGRFFHPHAKDQIQAFINGDKMYWWFSDKTIQEHKKTSLLLKP